MGLLWKVMEGYFVRYSYISKFNWNKLLKILARSLPISLSKFKFCSKEMSNLLEALPLFLNNWKDRHPILLQTYDSPQYQKLDNYIK
jgi:hypothetical protein